MTIAQQMDKLLLPIEGENPAGVYLKDDRTSYRPLRNAYNVAQTSFRKLTNNPPEDALDDLQQENLGNWQVLSDQLKDVIATRSKDLECISWLALAQLFSRQPYENLAGCLQLIEVCVSRFGEQVHPRVPDAKLRTQDEAGKRAERAELQLRPLVQIFGESEESSLLGLPLRMLPLIADIDFTDWRNADRQGNRNELQQRARQALADEQGQVIERILAIGAALKTLDVLDSTLSEYAKSCGATSVSSRFLRAQLNANLNAIKVLTDGALVPWPLDVQSQSIDQAEVVEEENTETDDVPAQPEKKKNTMSAQGEAIYNRDQAFQQLRLIADYFSRTEPQSPVSGLIEKAIRWGYTPLPDLINELVQGHDGLMGRIGELTGMNAEKVHIPGSSAQELVAPPTENPKAPSQLRSINRESVLDNNTSVQSVSKPPPTQEKNADVPPVPAQRSTHEPEQRQADVKTQKPQTGVPSFVNLSSREEKKPIARKSTGPGGIDLSQLKKR
ncbi:type VI secretion system ImpA family N-terminal domain-containing protein [Parendozoicomonas sp. Alg238-R29]|uniref:type VI secretion system protein TssA n=1 Tax=Parendozoicomonas sp. Alg238-R29 TaxID=2993446 RepID=UPI00248DADDD|nr:type VI secretion system ImpA family N-terminal domain-containing protein [Parendozoicomonas sp. Alg238-R29]